MRLPTAFFRNGLRKRCGRTAVILIVRNSFAFAKTVHEHGVPFHAE